MDRDALSAFALLTHREWAVLPLLARGMSDHEIASTLGLASGTTRTHVADILRKLQGRSRRDIALLFASIPMVNGSVDAWGVYGGVLTSDEVSGEVLAWPHVVDGSEHLVVGDRVVFRYGPLAPSATYRHQAVWVRKS